MSMTEAKSYRLGVDVGGTFTDLVLVAPDGRALTRKVLSTTANYAEAIITGTTALLADAGLLPSVVGDVIHGTTVATNAILERRGESRGMIPPAGFRDLLEIGRLRLARLYDLDFERPAPRVSRRLRLEVGGRMSHVGEVVTALDRESVERAVDRLAGDGVESIAVCLLHAYANPAHEQAVGAIVRERAPGLALTLSSEILPEMREFERTSTAVTNAYVMPVMARYLESLEREPGRVGLPGPLLVMQSNGGVMTAEHGRRRPVHVIESGPAAGVIATAALARRIGEGNVISIDMGGTTAKASVIEGFEIKRTGEFEIGGSMSQGSRLYKGSGYLLRVPAIDIAEVGAGGGSIVSVDGAGALHVGPRSAGAVRAVTIERGRDPQEFTLIAFGGNGPLFAAEMARSLEIARVLVPPAPGVWSALGLLEAEMEHHLVRTFLRPLAGLEPRDLVEALASLEREAESLLRAQGYGADRVEIERSADLKYQGQSFELSVPLGPSAIGIDGLSRLAEAFDKEHERTYGHKAEGDPIQIVNLRLTARVRRATDLRRETRFIPGARARGGEREAYFGPGHGTIRTPVIGREDLDARPRSGPLLIDEYDATTLVLPDCLTHLDAHGNIVIDTGG